MLFDRKIKYFDYLEHGNRMHGAGFVKLEVRNNRCDLQIQISGMHVTDHFTREILLVSPKGEKTLGELLLSEGKSSRQFAQLDCMNLENTGISYKELQGIRIPIAAGKEIYCKIQESKVETEERLEEELLLEPTKEAQLVSEEELLQETKQETKQETIKETTQEILEETLVEIEGQEGDAGKQEKMLAETKWKQLSAIYPHIAPFKDERDYLSIGPGDFVILPDKYYRLANNSFLLHGYYNYKHLILSRMQIKGQSVYYIGVPGNFYEREKQVAVLFGFESFECFEEPARAGDYGYYMLRVEL